MFSFTPCGGAERRRGQRGVVGCHSPSPAGLRIPGHGGWALRQLQRLRQPSIARGSALVSRETLAIYPAVDVDCPRCWKPAINSKRPRTSPLGPGVGKILQGAGAPIRLRKVAAGRARNSIATASCRESAPAHRTQLRSRPLFQHRGRLPFVLWLNRNPRPGEEPEGRMAPGYHRGVPKIQVNAE